MRLITVLLAATVLAPGLAAQDVPISPLALPIHGGRPSEVLERPADVVARLARQALTTPGDTATWNALATALPAMALTGGADLEGVFEAARVADSLSAAAGMVAGAADEPPMDLGAVEANVVAAPFPGLPVQVGFGLALGALFLGGILWFRARRRGRQGSRRGGAPVLAAAGRLWTARTLAVGGVAVPEIAKRTGMAQEAVKLALSMAGHSPLKPAPAGRASKTRDRSGRTVGADGGPEARLRQEVAAAASRLKDRRLTYGGVR